MTEAKSQIPVQFAEGDISVLEFWRAIVRDWRVVSSIIVLAAISSIAVALILKPIYRAEITVIEEGQGPAASPTGAVLGQLGGLASLAGINLGTLRGDSTDFRATLKSRMIVQEFISRNNLLPVLFADQWNKDTNSWSTPPEETPTLWRGVKYFIENIRTVEEDLTDGVIRIGIEWTDPIVAASWANGMIALVNDVIRKRDLAEAKRNMTYLNNEISRTSVVELQMVLYSLIEAEMKTIMLANSKGEYAFSVVDPAVAPELRSFPNRALISIAGTIFGVFLALVVVLVRLVVRRQKQTETLVA